MDPIQKSLINVRGQLQKAEERIQDLEENLKDAEDAARFELFQGSTYCRLNWPIPKLLNNLLRYQWHIIKGLFNLPP